MREKNDTALNLYIPTAVRERLEAEAKRRDRSMSYIVRKAILEHLDKQDKERGE